MPVQDYEKIVKLACKPKNAPPKAKYIDALIAATYADDRTLEDIIQALAFRLRDNNGVVVFKALLTLHQMIRTGASEGLLEILARHDVLKLRGLGGRGYQGYIPPASLGAYADYLDARIRSYRDVKHDLVRVQTESNRRSDGLGAASKARRLRHLPVEKGLLREVKQVQKLLDALVRCKFYDDDLRDENTVLALRLLVKDLLVLFQAGNEGVCNILEHYFEMSKIDATDAFQTYKSFISQTDRVVDYLSIARKLNHILNVPVPNLKHAPTGLVKALEEYLEDPNFEQNRLEYKRSLGVVEGRGEGSGSGAAAGAAPAARASSPSKPKEAAKPTENLVKPAAAPPGSSQKIQDFFESIQADSQPTMFGGPPQQMNYANMTVNQQQFNPFRQSMMYPQQTGFMQPQQTGFPPQQQQPFHQQPFQQQQQGGFLQPQQTGAMAFGNRQSIFPGQMGAGGEFGAMQPQQTGFIQPQPQAQPQQHQQQLQPQQTGFLQPQSTGSNPFRQSMMFGSQPASPFGQGQGNAQIQRPGSTPAFGSGSPFAPQPTGAGSSPFKPTTGNARAGLSASPKPLQPQATGSKNPFAPAPGSAPAASSASMQQQQERKPTMNELLMGYGQGQGPQGQGQLFGQGQGQGQGQQGQGQGDGMSSIASQFAVGEKSNGASTANGNNDIFSQFSSLSGNPTGSTSPPSQPASTSFGGLSSNPTGATSLSSQPTGLGAAGFLQPQQTGYGGSNIKPFKPSSSFGNTLMESLPPIPEPGSGAGTPRQGQGQGVTSPSAGGLSAQATGFPGLGQGGFLQPSTTGLPQSQSQPQQRQHQPQSQFGQTLSPQMTGANPFRQSTMFGAAPGAAAGAGAGGAFGSGGGSLGGTGAFGGGAGGGLNPQLTGAGAFGVGSPFGGQGQFGQFGQQQQQQQAQQTGQAFGGQQQQQGGSLI
ncbi:hypothetical protein I350_08398 [Cryptococcus amylolentus CBS 6273]|uniref:ENTH domain-containing protein n=1 Tax=Cryptococcus amylolentus CBS 6273 TaxID=1296118 RepID=A0A1E3J6W5_9TREE|nr:hypothetical protein I350_08398 [Cryptococcus amylolentus CBS 6273]